MPSVRPCIRIHWGVAPPADVFTAVYGAGGEEGGGDAVPMGRQRNVVPYVSHVGIVFRQFLALEQERAVSLAELHRIHPNDRAETNPASLEFRKRYKGAQKGCMVWHAELISRTEPAVVGARNEVEQTVDNDAADDD